MGRWGLALGLLGISTSLGCARKGVFNLGIQGGTQTLWRYLAHRKEAVLRPLGYEVSFRIFPSEEALSQAFLKDKIQVAATLASQLPLLAESIPVQFFLPMAWVRDGFPIIVPAGSPVMSLPELSGKRLSSFPLDHPGFAYWRALALENYGFRIEERMNLIPSLAPEVPLREGQAEAAVVASPAWSALKQEGGYRLLSDLATEWRKLSPSPEPLMFGGYMARKAWIQGQRGFVEDLIRLHHEALRRYQDDREAVLAAATAYSGPEVPPLTRQVNQDIASYLGLDVVSPERVYISNQDVEDYRRIYALLARAGYLRSEPRSAEDLFYHSQQRPP